MSYGQRTFFDRRTHQRRSAVVARLSYTYGASKLLEGAESRELTERVLEHLTEAQAAVERILGRSEVSRLGAMRPADLDEKVQSWLRRALGEDGYSQAQAGGTIGSLPMSLRDPIARALGKRMLAEFHRRLILSVGDRLWVEYLTEMEALRTSIGLEAYGQRDPLVQYKSRAFDMFQTLLTNIRAGVVAALFRIGQPTARPQPAAAPVDHPERAPAAEGPASTDTVEAEEGDKKRRRRRRR